MIHEDAALERHPKAKEFRPVKRVRTFVSTLIGWTFEVPRNGVDSASKSFGWVTRDGEVSSDTLSQRETAEKNLAEYMKARRGSPKELLYGEDPR